MPTLIADFSSSKPLKLTAPGKFTRLSLEVKSPFLNCHCFQPKPSAKPFVYTAGWYRFTDCVFMPTNIAMAFAAPTSTRVFFGQRTSAEKCAVRTSYVTPRMCIPTSEIPDVLKSILDRKRVEVDALKEEISAKGEGHPIAGMLSSKGSLPRLKTFRESLDLPPGSLTVIAEIKRRSPSKGKIGEIKDPAHLSRTYNDGGAGAISVLTDLEGFGGTMDDLRKVVKAQDAFKGDFPGPCPVLRKEFIIDEIQIAEAAEAGASAILLIVAALGKERTKELLEAAHAFGLDALVEVHSEKELEIALDIGADIVGVNNRDLHTFDVSLDTSFRLAPLIPDGVIKVAESGIVDCIDAWKLRDAGFSAVLVGETLVTAYENSGDLTGHYTVGYNQAKGFIKAYCAKGSVEYGNSSMAPFFGKGEGAKETLGELMM